MIFSSLLFLFKFLPVVLIVYFMVPAFLRNFVLFAASLIFYSWGEPVYVLLMLFSTAVDFVHGKLVYRFKMSGRPGLAKAAVISSVIINLSLLGFFKYGDFFLASINNIFGVDIALLNVALPIGISFYTFQTMSYSLDIYMNDEKPQNNIISFGTYVALFPQLIAGPIVRYKDIARELTDRKENIDDFFIGIRYFICGLGKKVLLANNIGLLWKNIKAMEYGGLSAAMAWIGIIAFAFQIYFDFSGYSDMAIGLGRMFGFKFPVNFDYPYISRSITEFWRRWHISLGTWFREYVYIPLGGNRTGSIKHVRNILTVWFLTGLWHGASYNFILWGMYFGVILLIEKKVGLLKALEKLPAFAGHIYAVFLILAGWVIFEFDSMKAMGGYFKAMFGLNGAGFADMSVLFTLREYGVLFIVLIFAATPLPKLLMQKVFEKNAAAKMSFLSFIMENAFNIVVLALTTAYLADASYNPFLYFRF